MQTEQRQDCEGFQFELLSVQANIGATERKRFHVRIFNARNIRVGYLRDFSSGLQAITAAKQWVADRKKNSKISR